MKQHWYLVSSLPSLRLGEKPAMDVAAFRAACVGWLSGAEQAVVDAALENREPPTDSADAWWNGEVQLRDAVVRVRAKQRNTDGSRYIRTHEGFSVTIEKMVADAFSRANPLEQEMELDRARWTLVDDLAVMDAFGFPAVLAFAVKLRIAERWAGLEEQQGRETVDGLIEQTTSLENEQETKS